VIDGPFISLFDNRKPPYNFPELVHMKAKGQNFFIPIPFQKSIRIVGGPGWGKYYQISYTTFPEGTTVPSFTGTFSEADRAALQKANDVWGKRGPAQFVGNGAEETGTTFTLARGEERTVASFKKPGVITSMVMKRWPMDREASVAILRELAISITWDGQPGPAVWAPLGDFFGTGGGENLYRSLMTGMTEESYYANWYMPFAKARVAIRNDRKAPQTLVFTIHTEKVGGDVEKLLRYHCKWHRDDFSGFEVDRFFDDRWPDWPVLKVDGAAGRFCGFQAHMWNPFHLWNGEHKARFEKAIPPHDDFKPGGAKHGFYKSQVAAHYWWGEGDEKFFVDGEKMPSTFGTGTEDYFGYAWGTPQAYDSALQAQPRNGAADEIGKSAGRGGPGNIGHITMLRWQVPDNIPFQKSFEAVIEKYHPNEWPLLNAYAASWYQAPGTTDYYKPVPSSERSNYFVPANRRPPKPLVNGLYECESGDHVEVVGKPRGRVWVQEMGNWGRENWSDGRHLIWMCGREGLEMTLSFEAQESGKALRLGFTKAPDYGIFECTLDGKRIGEAFDLFDPKVIRAQDVTLDPRRVSKGKHELKIKCVGKNEKSRGFLFAIDYLQVVKEGPGN